jgi:hypothetical protein
MARRLISLADADRTRLGRRLAAEVEEVQGDGENADITIAQFEAAIAEAWTMGARVVSNGLQGRRPCRVCGCWELQACDNGCAWAEPDLCTECDTMPAEPR